MQGNLEHTFPHEVVPPVRKYAGVAAGQIHDRLAGSVEIYLKEVDMERGFHLGPTKNRQIGLQVFSQVHW